MPKQIKRTVDDRLPKWLHSKILSAVDFIWQGRKESMDESVRRIKAVERINTIREHLSDKEVMWVMSLLTFEKLLELVKDSDEFKHHTQSMKARTIQ